MSSRPTSSSTPAPPAEHPYLSDFGLAKRAASSDGLTGTGQFLGTPDYAVPEQISGKPARPQTDQYALACVAYTVLTGRLPFGRNEPMAILWAHMHEQPPLLTASRPDLPAAADQVLARALAKVPEDRYPTCSQFVDALGAALDRRTNVTSGSENNAINVRDATTGKLIAAVTDPEGHGATGLTFNPGDTELAVTDTNVNVNVWKISQLRGAGGASGREERAVRVRVRVVAVLPGPGVA